jgi:hypothetical protein
LRYPTWVKRKKRPAVPAFSTIPISDRINYKGDTWANRSEAAMGEWDALI